MNGLAASIVLAIGLSSAGFFIGDGVRFLKTFDRAVDVKGFAERIVTSTDANWKLDFSSSGNDLNALNAEVLKSQEAIKAFLIKNGFEESDFQLGPVEIVDSLADRYSSKPATVRYTAKGAILVVTKKVDNAARAATATQDLLKSGVLLERSNITYHFTELNSIKADMLKEATANAREAANGFAQASNSKVGTIKSASQGLFTISSPLSNSPSDYEQISSLPKKVRVVTQVSYFLE